MEIAFRDAFDRLSEQIQDSWSPVPPNRAGPFVLGPFAASGLISPRDSKKILLAMVSMRSERARNRFLRLSRASRIYVVLGSFQISSPISSNGMAARVSNDVGVQSFVT